LCEAQHHLPKATSLAPVAQTSLVRRTTLPLPSLRRFADPLEDDSEKNIVAKNLEGRGSFEDDGERRENLPSFSIFNFQFSI